MTHSSVIDFICKGMKIKSLAINSAYRTFLMFTFRDVSPSSHAKPPINLLSSFPGLINFEYPCRLMVDKSYRSFLMTTNERYSAEKYYNCLQNT